MHKCCKKFKYITATQWENLTFTGAFTHLSNWLAWIHWILQDVININNECQRCNVLFLSNVYLVVFSLQFCTLKRHGTLRWAVFLSRFSSLLYYFFILNAYFQYSNQNAFHKGYLQSELIFIFAQSTCGSKLKWINKNNWTS